MSLFETHSFLVTVAYFLGLAVPIMTLLAPNSDFYAFSHVVPHIITRIFQITTVFMIPIEYMIIKLYGWPPKSRGLFGRTRFFIEFLLVVIVMFLYNLIPYTKAQIDIMFGKFGKFYVVEKHRH